MSSFYQQVKWQFVLLQRNSVISISIAVTVIYGIILFTVRDLQHLDKVLVALVLNDPSVIGYFFIALTIFTERKNEVLAAIFITPVNIHHFLIARVTAISIIGALCALGLAISVLGTDFDMIPYFIGSWGISILSALLGLYMVTYAEEFLSFALRSIPVFIIFINVPLLQYLELVELNILRYVFPIQGSLDLIIHSISGEEISHSYAYLSMLFMVPLFYWIAYRRFSRKLIYG